MEESPFRLRLKDVAAKRSWGPSDDVWKLREAASVLAAFDPASLHAVVKVSSSARTELLADCDIAGRPDGSMGWRLRTPIRQAALRRLLATDGVQPALDSNPERPKTEAQLVLERTLTGQRLPPWESASTDRQRALLEVIEWLDGLPELSVRLPPAQAVKDRLAWQELLQPFRDLIGPSFAGRRPELTQLGDYVGVRDASTVLESWARVVEQVFSIKERPPLFIHGPGGCGKSTLIARFILDHADLETLRIPFAYLDFDRPGLVAEEPITLLIEIMRQLALQYPGGRSGYYELSEQWSTRASEQLKTADGDPDAVHGRFRLTNREAFLNEFSRFIDGLKIADHPLLLVLDTFEEVQFRSASFAEEVLDFLNLLQSRLPRLRTVLCGRAEIVSTKYSVRTVTIGNFDKEAAVAFLEGRGIDNPLIAARVFDQVGGSPLVLRLAADVARIESVTQEGISGLSSGWLSAFRTQSIEVVLYKRILSHVYDKRVQELAYPGLILRIITPDLLQKVLAPACVVPIASAAEASALVAIMRGQLTTILVPGADRETLVHRPDMRSILLQDLAEKSRKDSKVAATLQRIHDAAILYYETYEDAANRAEELYHRLALGVDRAVLDRRWLPDLTPFLGSSIRELPAKSQMYLAARLGLELPESMWSEAEDPDWILYAVRTIAQKLELHRPLEALPVATARPHLLQDHRLESMVRRIAFDIFHDYARRYEEIRRAQASGDPRTRAMDALARELSSLCESLPADPSYGSELFAEGTAGARVGALAFGLAHPTANGMDMAIDVIRDAQSPFEQYYALRLALGTFGSSNASQRAALRDCLLKQKGVPIHDSDASRARIKADLLKRLGAKAVT